MVYLWYVRRSMGIRPLKPVQPVRLVLENRKEDMLVLLADERPIAVFDSSVIAAEVWRQLKLQKVNC